MAVKNVLEGCGFAGAWEHKRLPFSKKIQMSTTATYHVTVSFRNGHLK